MLIDDRRIELRQVIPDGYPLRITKSDDASKTIWCGGANLATDSEALKSVLVTRQDYQEHGSGWLAGALQVTNSPDNQGQSSASWICRFSLDGECKTWYVSASYP